MFSALPASLSWFPKIGKQRITAKIHFTQSANVSRKVAEYKKALKPKERAMCHHIFCISKAFYLAPLREIAKIHFTQRRKV